MSNTFNIKDYHKLSSLELKGKIFIDGIEKRVKESLEYIKIKYTNLKQFELAIDFMGHTLTEGIKSDIKQLNRVGYFPSTEAEMEADHAIKHALIGSYKSSFADLRRILELILTSIYLTSEQTDAKKAIEWLKSNLNTPFFSEMLEKLNKCTRFNDINKSYDWANHNLQQSWRF